MDTTEQLLGEAVNGDLKTLYNIAGTLKGDDKDVLLAYEQATTGVKTKWHIAYYLEDATIDMRTHNIIRLVTGEDIDWIQGWVEEIQRREDALRSAIIKHYEDEELEGR